MERRLDDTTGFETSGRTRRGQLWLFGQKSPKSYRKGLEYHRYITHTSLKFYSCLLGLIGVTGKIELRVGHFRTNKGNYTKAPHDPWGGRSFYCGRYQGPSLSRLAPRSLLAHWERGAPFTAATNISGITVELGVGRLRWIQSISWPRCYLWRLAPPPVLIYLHKASCSRRSCNSSESGKSTMA